MGNANEKLIKGTTVYMIGNLTSKLMQLFLLPIVTGLLLPEEYGYCDLVISTASLVIPIITLQLTEALFKYLFKSNQQEKKAIISTVVAFLTVGILLLAIVLLILNEFSNIIQYPILIFIHYATFTIYTLYQKISRSLQKNKAFAISGVLHTFALIITEIILLLGFKMRVEALLIANVVSNLVCIVYLEQIIKVRNLFSLKAINVDTLSSLLKFSIPLVPNSISWWFVNSINTYFVTFFLGVGANGIYSVANKFPQLLTFVTSVFQMAWQESAIMESDSTDRNSFYSSVINSYIKFLLTACIVILPIIKIFIPYLVDERYLSGISIIPILLLGAVFSALSQFYGVGYIAFNQTRGALSTTIIAALTNCLFVVIFIKPLGILAPALGTMVAYLVQWIYRIYQMRSYFKLQIVWETFIIYGFVSIVYMILFYLSGNNLLQGSLLVIAIVIFLVSNKVLIKNIISKVTAKLINKNKNK